MNKLKCLILLIGILFSINAMSQTDTLSVDGNGNIVNTYYSTIFFQQAISASELIVNGASRVMDLTSQGNPSIYFHATGFSALSPGDVYIRFETPGSSSYLLFFNYDAGTNEAIQCGPVTAPYFVGSGAFITGINSNVFSGFLNASQIYGFGSNQFTGQLNIGQVYGFPNGAITNGQLVGLTGQFGGDGSGLSFSNLTVTGSPTFYRTNASPGFTPGSTIPRVWIPFTNGTTVYYLPGY